MSDPEIKTKQTVRTDWFIGDIASLKVELDIADRESLYQAAREFLLSGLTWERWTMLAEESRAAFVAAGLDLRVEQAQAIADALARILEGEEKATEAPDPPPEPGVK